MKLAFIVGVGSFLGGVFRYLLSTMLQTKVSSTFPYGTFTVNMIGCFFIGCLFGISVRWGINEEWRLFLMTGILGKFTTFSAFSLETNHLLKSGQRERAIIYIVVSILVGLGLTFLGTRLFSYTPFG